MASTEYQNLVGAPQMSVINPVTGQAYAAPYSNTKINASGYVDMNIPEDQKHIDHAFEGYSKFRDTSRGSIDDTLEYDNNDQPKTTAKAVSYYASGMADIMKGGAAISNGYIANMSANMKANSYKFQAEQERLVAESLLKNQIDITRAAQMDSNQYRIAGAEKKAKQVVAMSKSGFAVGKGSYRNTLNTTEARVNYNVANLMLRADLQNAELTRKAGAYQAQAIIREADAEIAKKEGKMAIMNGWINGISNFLSAGAMFTCGLVEDGYFSGSKTTTFKNSMGGTSTVVHGGYTKIDI